MLGNLKFDIAAPPELVARGRGWRDGFGGRLAWVAASTRDGEEMHLLEAFRRMQGQSGDSVSAGVDVLKRPASEISVERDARSLDALEAPLPGASRDDTRGAANQVADERADDALLILVPRHPQRFEEIATLLERSGVPFVRRSRWVEDAHGAPRVPAHIQVVLGDSMGEMAAYYAAADLAFIGGSLLPLGGQNLIEACAIGTPVLVGPHTFNFTQATADAIAAGAALRVADAVELATRLRELLHDRARRCAMSGAAAAFAARHRGATARTVAVLIALLPR